MNKTQLWDAINQYVISCGGDPSSRVYGNTDRQEAVVLIESGIQRLRDKISNQRERLRIFEEPINHAGGIESSLKDLGDQLKQSHLQRDRLVKFIAGILMKNQGKYFDDGDEKEAIELLAEFNGDEP